MSSLGNWVRSSPEPVANLAKQLGVTRITLHRYMSGAQMPRPHGVRAIVELTDGAVTAAELERDYVGRAAK